MQSLKKYTLLELVKNESNKKKEIPSLNRYVYVGEYANADTNDFVNLIKAAKKTNKGNKKRETARFTGLLIVYPKLVVHYLECSEEFMNKHCTYLQTSTYKRKKIVTQFKLLSAKHNIFGRMFDSWKWIDVDVKERTYEVEENSIEKNKDYMKNICVLNLFHVATLLRNFTIETSSFSLRHQIAIAIPKREMIKFLLKSEYFPSFKQILELLKNNALINSLIVWPSQDTVYPNEY